MRRENRNKEPGIESEQDLGGEKLGRVLRLSLFAIGALIVLGSVLALLFRPNPAQSGADASRAPEYMTILDADRIPLLDGGLAVVTLKVGIPAQRDQEGDRAFREELGKQAQALKDSARFYLSGKPASELKDLMVRDALKASLLGVLNRALALGSFSRIVALEIDVI